LTGGVDDPQLHRHARKIAIRSEFPLAAPQISISGITTVGDPVNLYRRLIVRL
jgi:hypothetical protein